MRTVLFIAATLLLSACGSTMERKAASGAVAGAMVGGPVGAVVGAAAGAATEVATEKGKPRR